MRAVDVATRSILLLTPEPLVVVATVNILVRGFGPDLPIQLACQVGGCFNKRARAGLHGLGCTGWAVSRAGLWAGRAGLVCR